MRLVRVLALGLAGLALAGCGGGDDDGGEAAEPAATAGADSGEAIFGANCAGCHTLAAAGAGATVGPNLDELQPDQARVAEQVENGGGGMPAFGEQLSDEQIQVVAAYVADNAGG